MTTGFVERIGYRLAEKLGIDIERNTHLALADLDAAIGFPEVESSYGGWNGKESLDYERIKGIIEDREYLTVRRKTDNGERKLFVEYSDVDLVLRVIDTDVKKFLWDFLFVDGDGVYKRLKEIADNYFESISRGEKIDKIEEHITINNPDRYNLEDILLNIL